MKQISINNCDGYLWMSDQQKPIIIEGKPFNETFDETKNPFFVEGQLYDKDELVSYNIKYIDGRYYIIKYKVEEVDFTNKDNEEKCYLSNRMDDRWLKFLRFWEPKPDPLCEGMEVLKLTKNVFVGFKKKED